MDYLLQIFNYGVEGYKAYETKEIAKKQLDNLFKLLTLLVAMYFLYKIIRG
jgi:hypothetical protein